MSTFGSSSEGASGRRVERVVHELILLAIIPRTNQCLAFHKYSQNAYQKYCQLKGMNELYEGNGESYYLKPLSEMRERWKNIRQSQTVELLRIARIAPMNIRDHAYFPFLEPNSFPALLPLCFYVSFNYLLYPAYRRR